ncbi:type VI secretion system amidase effector protein Tae4 [Pantoea deleyi]|uniref:type VI secretion system amidase effector protein Tae4 n=1 Tax=Pantoea TaxID=53335 RepID=UPI000DA78C6B|nr:type VI secretion system amidase effector protein Tae4 [Pantoea sp. ARC607]PZL93307.1 hypothetical protein CKF43_13670 [Pantoea sp. ARC607]
MAHLRPQFSAAWNRFSEVNVSVEKVGEILGGKVEANIAARIFENACPIRMSYVLNYTGLPVPANSRYATVTGKDKKRYMFRVNDMMDFLVSAFGQPDLTVKSPKPGSFNGKQGIIVFQGSGWSNARGHVTLWNGNICSDTCHFLGGAENGSFVPDVASLWILK